MKIPATEDLNKIFPPLSHEHKEEITNFLTDFMKTPNEWIGEINSLKMEIKRLQDIIKKNNLPFV